jgi:hypothetical protein
MKTLYIFLLIALVSCKEEETPEPVLDTYDNESPTYIPKAEKQGIYIYGVEGDQVILSNDSINPISIKDWVLKNSEGKVFVFPDIKINHRQQAKLNRYNADTITLIDNNGFIRDQRF